MYNHYYDAQGYYMFSTEVMKGSIQAPNCIRSDKAIDIPEKFWATLNSDKTGFDTVPDHREEIWFDKNRNSIIIKELGDPSDWGLLKELPEINEEISSLIVTAAQAKIALFRSGYLEQVEAIVLQYPKDIQIWYESALYWERNNPYILGLGLELGLDDKDIDNLFEMASKL